MDDLGDFHKAVAACVFIKYISLSSATPAFKVKDLCFWAQKMIEVGLEHIQAGLSSVNVSLEQTDDGVFQFMCSELPVVDLTKLGADVAESQRETIESFVAKGPDEGLRRIVDNITGHIATLFQRHAPENARFVDMSDIAVVHPGELWTEEWAAMYMCCWQASGAEKSLLCPPVHVWEDHHFAWRNQKEATKRTHTEILMGEYMACFLIPCHEVIHIAQHIAGVWLLRLNSSTQLAPLKHKTIHFQCPQASLIATQHRTRLSMMLHASTCRCSSWSCKRTVASQHGLCLF